MILIYREWVCSLCFYFYCYRIGCLFCIYFLVRLKYSMWNLLFFHSLWLLLSFFLVDFCYRCWLDSWMRDPLLGLNNLEAGSFREWIGLFGCWFVGEWLIDSIERFDRVETVFLFHAILINCNLSKAILSWIQKKNIITYWLISEGYVNSVSFELFYTVSIVSENDFVVA